MPNASFVQTNFLGGEWSPSAQGRTDDQAYHTAVALSLNAYPRINGSWTRRQGFMYMSHTRQGKPGRLIGLEFSFSDPYQLELTDGYLRFYKGNSPVYTGDANVVVKSISTANPAVVTVQGVLPSGWATGNTATFNMLPPASAPILAGRQYTIKVLTGTTFALYDSLTGASIDGSTFTYTAPASGPPDRVYKILELTTPYMNGTWKDVRILKTDTQALLLHPKYVPQLLTLTSGAWAIAPQFFSDGPYLDVNTTAITLTPSGTSGSITLTASVATGINGGAGFLATDVGRLVRLMTGPPAWAGGTTYAKAAIVLGSDTNIYVSQTGGNVGNNPTTDSGANWVLSGDSVVWTWLQITAWTSSTVVTATVKGANLYSSAAVTSWQMGYFSYTDGWPANGTYHEGRFWLGGGPASNRLDSSMSNDILNFSPTGKDGTVADNNGISATLNAPEVNFAYWMTTTQQGILVGTQAGEWLIAASSLNDPLTPTSIQAHRVSTYGCANIEPVVAALTTVFVQRQQRKILDYAQYPYGEAAGWYAADLTLLADHVTNGGIEEIRWQQEPNKMLWARRADGTLVGATFQHAPYGRESYNGWHRHSLGGGRTVESLSSGPTFDGLSTTIYAVVSDGTYRHAVALSPVFDDSVADWASTFTDGVGSPQCSQIKSTTAGDSYNGLRMQGLANLNGQTVTAVIGGMDLGDFAVANGYIDIPFTATFTQAFLDSLNDGTDYSGYQIEASTYHTPTGEAIGEYTNSGTALANTTGFAIDKANKWFLYMDTGRVVRCNLDTMAVEQVATTAQLFNGNPSGWTLSGNGFFYHPQTKKLYVQQAGNSTPYWVIDAATLTLSAVIGTFNSRFGSLEDFTAGLLNVGTGFNSSIPLVAGTDNLFAHTEITGAGSNRTVSLWNADTSTLLGLFNFTDTEIWICPGAFGQGDFWAMGTPSYGPASTSSWNLYHCTSAFATTTVGAISPSTVDATWTHFSGIVFGAYDPTDGNILAYATTSDVVTNTAYFIKISTSNASILWRLADTTSYPANTLSLVSADISDGKYRYVGETGSSSGYQLGFYTLDLAAGTLTTAVSTQLANIIGNGWQFPYREKNAVGTAMNWTVGTQTPTFLNTYASTGGAGWYLVTLQLFPDLYKIPASIGLTYTSQGQLLKPDQGQEAGAADGPAFAKLRRLHKYGLSLYRSQTVSLGTDFVTMDSLAVQDENNVVVSQPNLFTGLLRGTLENSYSTEGQMTWQVTRPTPLTIVGMGGFIATQDE